MSMQPIDNESRFVNVCENTGYFINFICFVNIDTLSLHLC